MIFVGVVGRLKDGDLLISGNAKERDPAIRQGLVCHFPFDGTPIGKTYGRNLVETSDWVVGRKGTQGKFSLNGTADENDVILYPNPWGDVEPIWASLQNDEASNADGGWSVNNRPIDRTKKYRLTVWIRRENFGNGSAYLGCQASTVCNLGTATVNTNPYFVSGNFAELRDEWVLFVAYIHPHDYTGGNDPTNGMYFRNGKRIRTITDFKWTPTATVGGHRSYMYYSTKVNERQYWARPRFEMCNGFESTIEDLINGVEDNVRPIVNVSTTLTEKEIAVEGAIENHILPSFNGEGNENIAWGKDTTGVTFSTIKDVRIAKFGEYTTRLSKDAKTGTSNCYINGAKFTNTESDVWTFSCYVRREDGKPVTSVGSVYLYCLGLPSWFQAPDYIEDCGDGWYRIVKTRRGIDIPRRLSLVGFSGLDTTTNWYFDGWQVEPLPYATSYKEGAKGAGRIDIPFDLKAPYAINLWHKGVKPLAEVIDQSTSPMIFQLNGYYTNASISFWNYVKKLVVYIKGDTEAAWSSNATYQNFTPDIWDNKEHMYTLVAVDKRTFKVYMDGVYLGQQVSSRDVTNIAYLSMGNASQPNAKYRDLSLYNRVLTDDEVKKLYGQSFSFDESGNLYVEGIVEKPNSVPQDALYIPLDFDAQDRFGIVSPNSEENIKYEDGAVFVGVTPRGDLEYNLHRDYGLDWSGDWSIAFWKKPDGTNSGLNGYNIESLGSGVNTVGGGYLWFGKNTGSNTFKIRPATDNSLIFNPKDYFEKWQLVSVVKKGNEITYTNRSRELGVFESSFTQSITKENYYVTQHGYDFKLGGWDNVNVCNSWFKDLMVAKRAFSKVELDAIFVTQMRARRDILQVQGSMKEGVVLLG